MPPWNSSTRSDEAENGPECNVHTHWQASSAPCIAQEYGWIKYWTPWLCHGTSALAMSLCKARFDRSAPAEPTMHLLEPVTRRARSCRGPGVLLAQAGVSAISAVLSLPHRRARRQLSGTITRSIPIPNTPTIHPPR